MTQSLEIPLARPVRPPLFGQSLPIGTLARVAVALVAAGCLAVLVVAAWLPPDPRGYGSHEAIFGAWPCGILLTTGLPCPTCGMTTAFSLVMHGRPLAAFVAQPAGVALCMGTIAAMVYSLHLAVRGRLIQVNWDRIGPARFSIGLALLLVLGWAFKLAHGLATGAYPVR